MMSHEQISKVERYNIQRDKWTACADFNIEIGYASCASFNDEEIYLVSGVTGQGFRGAESVRKVYKLIVDVDEWQELNITTPVSSH